MDEIGQNDENAVVTGGEADDRQTPEAERAEGGDFWRQRRCRRETRKVSLLLLAMITRVTAPAKMAERVGDLFRDQLEAMVRTQRSASAKPSPTTCREAAPQRCGWLLPTLLLRHTKAGDDVAENSTIEVTQDGSNRRKQDREVFSQSQAS